MRFLFSFTGGSGHAEPMVPIARALAAQGHRVTFTGRAPSLRPLAAAGFDTVRSGSAWADLTERRPLLPVDEERELRDVRDGFAGPIAKARTADLLTLSRDLHPDVLVRDEMDFAGAIVAERLGIAHVTTSVIAAGSLVRREQLAAPLNALRAEHGLPNDPELAMLTNGLTVSPFPATMREPGYPLPPGALGYRIPSAAGETPDILTSLTGKPTVYLTLGTVFNMESGDLFERLIAGVSTLPVELIVTVGRQIDPAEFGNQPANVHIRQFIPQDSLLPHCDLVVAHGGSGTTMATLANELPTVIAPMGADQPANARQCVRLGAGRALDVETVTPAEAAASVAEVLDDPSYREAAGRIRAEVDALPDADELVAPLTALAG